MATHARLISSKALIASADRAAGSQGVRMLREVIEHFEPLSESPMETRLRMRMVLGGLPRPVAQAEIRDRWHRVVARIDLYYPDSRLGIEYDGATHKNSIAEDNRRQNRLLEMGIRLLRFTAADIYDTPDLLLSQVRNALSA